MQHVRELSAGLRLWGRAVHPGRRRGRWRRLRWRRNGGRTGGWSGGRRCRWNGRRRRWSRWRRGWSGGRQRRRSRWRWRWWQRRRSRGRSGWRGRGRNRGRRGWWNRWRRRGGICWRWRRCGRRRHRRWRRCGRRWHRRGRLHARPGLRQSERLLRAPLPAAHERVLHGARRCGRAVPRVGRHLRCRGALQRRRDDLPRRRLPHREPVRNGVRRVRSTVDLQRPRASLPSPAVRRRRCPVPGLGRSLRRRGALPGHERRLPA